MLGGGGFSHFIISCQLPSIASFPGCPSDLCLTLKIDCGVQVPIAGDRTPSHATLKPHLIERIQHVDGNGEAMREKKVRKQQRVSDVTDEDEKSVMNLGQAEWSRAVYLSRQPAQRLSWATLCKAA